MIIFFKAAVSPLNLPFTILLVFFMFYWLLVILGAADMDWMPDIDIDDPGGVLASVMEMLNIGEVPIMAVISVMSLSCWSFSMLSNHYLNSNQSWFIGLILLIFNIVIGFFATVIFSKLLVKIIGPIGNEDKEDQKILYKMGTVLTSEVTQNFGQVEIKTKGAPITINARTPDGVILLKGEKALIFDEDKEQGIYFVDKYEE